MVDISDGVVMRRRRRKRSARVCVWLIRRDDHAVMAERREIDVLPNFFHGSWDGRE